MKLTAGQVKYISWATIPKNNFSTSNTPIGIEQPIPSSVIDDKKLNELRNQSYVLNQSYEPSVNVTIQITEDTAH